MWDYEAFDKYGTVVDIHFSNEDESRYSTSKTMINRDNYRLYELAAVRKSPDFYVIIEHIVTQDMEYSSIDMLIPVSMAYLVRRGTLKEFSEHIPYFFSDDVEPAINSLSENRLAEQVIEVITGRRIFIENHDDWDRVVDGKTISEHLNGKIFPGETSITEIRAVQNNAKH